jgi:hypothetical protein
VWGKGRGKAVKYFQKMRVLANENEKKKSNDERGKTKT